MSCTAAPTTIFCTSTWPDYAYGEAGDDWITGYRESTSPTNHRGRLNVDWGLI